MNRSSFEDYNVENFLLLRDMIIHHTQTVYLWQIALIRNSTFSTLSRHFFDLKFSEKYERQPLVLMKKKKFEKNFFWKIFGWKILKIFLEIFCWFLGKIWSSWLGLSSAPTQVSRLYRHGFESVFKVLQIYEVFFDIPYI